MVEIPLPALLALLGSLGITMVSAAWLWADARLTTNVLRSEQSRADHSDRDRQLLRDRLEAVKKTVDLDQAHHDKLVSHLERKLSNSTSERAKMEGDLRAVLQDLEQANARVSEVESKTSRLKEDLRRAGAERERKARAVRERDDILRSLDIRLDDEALAPTHPDARLRTRSVLRDLLMSGSADAVVLANTRGLAGLSAGSLDLTKQLASRAVLADQLVPALSAALCAPVTSVELVTPRNVLAFRRLSGTPWWLGLATAGDTPRAQLDLALLRLLGHPDRPDPVPELPDVLPDFPETDGKDERAERWCRRWGVESVAIVEASGVPRCLAGDLEPGAAWSVRRAMGPMRRRMLRDGWSLTQSRILARSPDGMAIEARWLGEDNDAPIMVARSQAVLPDEATSELGDVLRWAFSETTQQAL